MQTCDEERGSCWLIILRPQERSSLRDPSARRSSLMTITQTDSLVLSLACLGKELPGEAGDGLSPSVWMKMKTWVKARPQILSEELALTGMCYLIQVGSGKRPGSQPTFQCIYQRGQGAQWLLSSASHGSMNMLKTCEATVTWMHAQ